MKTLKNLIFVLFIGLATVTFTSCGDKSEDPTPAKSDLQLVKDGLVGKYFDFVSNTLSNGTTTITYNSGDCTTTVHPTWVRVNSGDVDFDFKSTTNVTMLRNCNTEQFNHGYTVTEVSGKIVININNDARKFELITPAKDFQNSSTITLKFLSINSPATSSIVTYNKL